MAALLLRHALKGEQGPLPGIEVESAGVAAVPGSPASPHAIKAMAKVGLDLSDHRASLFSPSHVEKSDLVLGMTEQHLQAIHSFFPDAPTLLGLFKHWMEDDSSDVPDPFGGSLNEYLYTRDSLVEAIPSILDFLKTTHADSS